VPSANLGGVSDLQCAARFIVVTSLADDLARRLSSERVAAVYDGVGSGQPATEALGRLAHELGVPVAPTDREVVVEEVRAHALRAFEVLSSVADLHRGETVLVQGLGEPDAAVEVLVDGDGMSTIR
jgi:hypothetical protein